MLRGQSAADSRRFKVQVCIGFIRGIASLNPDKRIKFPTFGLLCVVLVAPSATNRLFVRRSPTECVFVCVCVCDLGISTNSPQPFMLCAGPQKEINLTLTYKRSKCRLDLLPKTVSAVFKVVWLFRTSLFGISFA